MLGKGRRGYRRVDAPIGRIPPHLPTLRVGPSLSRGAGEGLPYGADLLAPLPQCGRGWLRAQPDDG